MRRFVSIAPEQIEARANDSADLVIDMALASETPVDRWYGVEILDHSPESVRLGRLNDGASVLFNHRVDEIRGVHIPGSARIDGDRVTRSKVQLTAATQAGRDAIALVNSRVLSKTSVGYAIHRVVEQSKGKSREIDGQVFERMVEQFEPAGDRAGFYRGLDSKAGNFERAADEMPTYRIMDWEPFETSLVSVPADRSVGIGRSVDEPEVRNPRANDAAGAANRGAKMPDDNSAAVAAAQTTQAPDSTMVERLRITTINQLCDQHKIEPSQRAKWIGEGASSNEVANKILDVIAERTKSGPQSDAKVGLGPREIQRYSLWKALRAACDNNWKDAGFELEASRAICQKLNRVPENNTLLIPFEVLTRPVEPRYLEAKRDVSVAASGGGYLVETSNLGFIDMLRNRSVAFKMGVQRLTGLVGNVNIPKQSATATAYWLAAETTQITESQQTFIQIPLTPRTAGAYTEISRLLLLQSSPDAEMIVTRDLAAVVALAVDLGVLAGTGTAQPQGIIGTSGVGTVTGTTFDYADILEFQSDVASANVMPVSGGYVATPVVAALAMGRSRFANTDTPLWQGNLWDGTMAGFPAMSSMQIPTGDMLFGDWSTVVVGEWGVLEVAINPVANFQAGIIGIRAMYTMDVGVRHPAAFSLMTSAT